MTNLNALFQRLKPGDDRNGKPSAPKGVVTAFPAVPDAPADLEALRAAMLRLDLRLRVAVEEMRSEILDRAADPLRGLYISDADIDKVLAETPALERARELLAQPIAAVAPRLSHMAHLFQLDAFEQEVVLICLAPDVDVRYERLYGYLQDDVSKRRPTVDLVLGLLAPTLEDQMVARRKLTSKGRLFAAGIVSLPDEASERLPLLSRPLRLDERITEYLLGSNEPDSRVAAFISLHAPDTHVEDFAPNADIHEGLARALAAAYQRPQDVKDGPVIYLHGQTPSARKLTLRTACRNASVRLLLVELDALLAAGQAPKSLTYVMREALLQNAVLAFEGLDPILTTEDAALQTFRNALRDAIQERPGVTLLCGDIRWEPATWLPELASLRVELHTLGLTERVAIWQNQLGGRVPEPEVIDLASRYKLDVDSVRAVDGSAQLYARWKGRDQAQAEDVGSAAKAISAPPMGALAKRVDTRHSWDDIILPADGLAQMKEMCTRARHHLTVMEDWGFGRKTAGAYGQTALFAGQPGTGKTMAAEIIAGDLGLELFRIDLSSIVSKYIGETEKNLEAIFRVADQGDAVLLFDEADALFGKRSDTKDAHDRYANIEIAYLLQRLETYNGIAVLTTNLRGNLDDAFLRRLNFVIEFPMPEEAERRHIWTLSLPPQAPLAPDADLDFMARKFKVAGGHIRNIAVTAAFLAAEDGSEIAMRHLIRATRREYQKLGKLIAESDFEQYFSLLKES